MPKVVREISAGGIVYREADETIEVALIATRKGKIWCLPKGGIEEGETVKEAARREIREETGLEAEMIESLGSLTYWFSNRDRAGELIRIFKRVYFFLFRYVSGRTEDHDDEVDDVAWFPIGVAVKKLSYPGERDMMKKAMVYLDPRRKKKPRGERSENRADF